MSDSDQKSNIHLFPTREVQRELQAHIESAPAPVNGVDTLSLDTAKMIVQCIERGEIVGLCAAAMDPKTGEPVIWTNFAPNEPARAGALRTIGVMKCLSDQLIEIALNGPEIDITVEPIKDDGDEE